MFNKKPINSIFRVAILLLSLALFSCKKEINIAFSEEAIASVKGAEITILYPEAEGNTPAVSKINKVIENHVVNAISFSEEELTDVHLADAVKTFNTEYERFKEEFPDSAQEWTASVEGEVIYQSPEIISVAMNTYLDTGGAHGNDNITFLNFNAETGDLLKNEDILKLNDKLTELAQKYFEEEVNAEDASIKDYFFGEPFHLPANIGFTEEGVVFLYNVYEIASYAQGYTEFVIPFSDIDSFLKVE
ncbi:DUF3298 domain-containing protein [Winogradskyella sp. 3972H.M.0a.05]|uniref:DUF3298 and DUF4163 domain-containing protein n=1 Tax=Winogradskyella sp. 3972H.M.0a.05 TaxID=2950277 RepID=UPI0033914DB5